MTRPSPKTRFCPSCGRAPGGAFNCRHCNYESDEGGMPTVAGLLSGKRPGRAVWDDTDLNVVARRVAAVVRAEPRPVATSRLHLLGQIRAMVADYQRTQGAILCRRCLRPDGRQGPHTHESYEGCCCDLCAASCWGACESWTGEVTP